MRVVIDTNVFISSFFGGKQRQVVDYWFSGRLTLCVSGPILREYINVLGRFQFEDDSLLLRFITAVERSSNILFIENPEEEQWITDDPADNKFIACAIALKAGYIVSGDSYLTGRG
ncbi:MAG TPA: putative toxin-antitoxin system toxin component, PIN family, partial [Dissulfurispiraceae bacterium]|nr:putative toxin-antitoxin system toxin component, PIN family [Dissulfurispiraceae bacterium]